MVTGCVMYVTLHLDVVVFDIELLAHGGGHVVPLPGDVLDQVGVVTKQEEEQSQRQK